MNTKYFSVSTIIQGKFFPAFQPVPESLVFAGLRKYAVDGPFKETTLQRSIQRQLDEQNALPPMIQAAVDAESDRIQEKPVVQAKIVPKGAVYDAYLPEDLDQEPEPLIKQPPVPDFDDAEDAEPKRPPKPKSTKPKPAVGQRFVRRGFAFRKVEDQEPLIANEKIYKRVGNAFVRVGRAKPVEKENK